MKRKKRQQENKMILTQHQKLQWKQTGALLLPGFFGDGKALQNWAEELYQWKETPYKWMKYFENGSSKRQLCRVENFLHRSILKTCSLHAGLCRMKACQRQSLHASLCRMKARHPGLKPPAQHTCQGIPSSTSP